MAAIVAAAYPEIFAAVGIHSGVARGAARNTADALGVMRGSTAAAPWQPLPRGIATIVSTVTRTCRCTRATGRH